MNNSKIKYIGFKTSGDWTVEEWNLCLVSVSKIYNVFLALEIIEEFENSIPDTITLDKLTVSKVLDNLTDFVEDNAKLRIHKINMASPGGFSLQGSGEIINAVTTFIVNFLDRIVPTKKTSAEIQIMLAQKDKIHAETERIKLENTRYGDETERIKTKSKIESETFGGKLTQTLVVLNEIKNIPYFDKEPYLIDGQDDKKIEKLEDQQLVIGYLVAGGNGLLVLEKTGKLINISENIHCSSK